LVDYRDTTHPEAGGAEMYLNEIFQRIAAHGHDVTLICARHPGAAREERIGGVRVLRAGNKATFNVVGAREALRVARRQGADLLVENICKIPFFLPAFTRTPVLPIVLHLFGSAVFQEVNPAFALYVWLYERLIPAVYRGLRVVAISESTAGDIVSPGLDLQRYRVEPSVPKSDVPLALYVGMLKRYKGIDTVIRAFAAARATIPKAQLVFAGRGNDRPRLEALVRDLHLEDCVKFTGWVSEDAKIDWLRRAHVLVYPSLKEGWGIPTMEAAACGTPTLASDSAGLRDAVRDRETGFLIPHNNVDAWTTRMVQILTDGNLCRRMGAAAVGWAQQFSWDEQAHKMQQIVEAVAASG
jgi:glycosyltransferase involved in cell wall biosynthesis